MLTKNVFWYSNDDPVNGSLLAYQSFILDGTTEFDDFNQQDWSINSVSPIKYTIDIASPLINSLVKMIASTPWWWINTAPPSGATAAMFQMGATDQQQ